MVHTESDIEIDQLSLGAEHFPQGTIQFMYFLAVYAGVAFKLLIEFFGLQ